MAPLYNPNTKDAEAGSSRPAQITRSRPRLKQKPTLFRDGPQWRTKMALPAEGQHHGVLLKAPEQPPLPQCTHNLFPGHKSVKTLGK